MLSSGRPRAECAFRGCDWSGASGSGGMYVGDGAACGSPKKPTGITRPAPVWDRRHIHHHSDFQPLEGLPNPILGAPPRRGLKSGKLWVEFKDLVSS